MIALRVGLIGAAVALYGIRWPADLVERWYSRWLYAAIQPALTGASNVTAFAWLDVLIVGAILGAALGMWRIVRTGRGQRWRASWRAGVNVATVAAVVYLAFCACWGLNYQREPITAWLDFDESRLTPERAGALADRVVTELVALQNAPSPASPEQAWPEQGGRLATAVDEAVRAMGLRGGSAAGRPKRSLLDPYFVRAGVSGMTDPFWLETLTASNLLASERSAVVAHEWAHLAGLARESEAAFAGWLACIHAEPWDRYSGWLDLFINVFGSLDESQRRLVMDRAPARVVRDLEEMRRRNQRDQVRLVNLVAWRTYDSYLKANRVASGVRNYNEVVRLVLGVRFENGWVPVRR